MGRKSSKLKLKPVLFIACEGTSTEFQYFESWGQTDQALEHFERVDVYPDASEKKAKTTPYELFLKAKDVLENGSANEAWIVFDKDMHPKLPQTFTEATDSGVKIAFSSRSFEEWVLLHYQKDNRTFTATECKDVKDKPIRCGSVAVPNCTPSDCLTGHIRRLNFIPNYSKKKDFDLYAVIKNRTEIGIVNSVWQRFKNGCSLNTAPQTLHDKNPYCDVDQLILKLNERTDKIEWGVMNQNITLENWTILVTKNQNNIVINLSHNQLNAQLLQNIVLSFFGIDDELNENTVNHISNVYINNNNGSTNLLLYRNDVIEFTISPIADPYLLFRIENIRIYIEL